MAHSVRSRLRKLANERNEQFDLLLVRYAVERFLARLSRSTHQAAFVLKGATLFRLWGDLPHRPTRDLDLLALGRQEIVAITASLDDILKTEVEEDGLSFDLSNVKIEEIREQTRYGGMRARFEATLDKTRIAVHIDFGVGDAVIPGPVETEFPTLLGMDAPRILVYPRATVVAEKLEAIVDLGMINSRMKDYFDLWFIATTFQDDPATLAEAVRQTFARREQSLPTGMPIGLTDAFADDPTKRAQWRAFRERAIGGSLELPDVVAVVREYARPLLL